MLLDLRFEWDIKKQDLNQSFVRIKTWYAYLLSSFYLDQYIFRSLIKRAFNVGNKHLNVSQGTVRCRYFH